MTESVDLSVITGVELELAASWPQPATAGTFEITGPPSTLAILKTFQASALQGSLSPRAAVTLPKAAKARAGIPIDAATFCICLSSR